MSRSLPTATLANNNNSYNIGNDGIIIMIMIINSIYNNIRMPKNRGIMLESESQWRHLYCEFREGIRVE
jgi:hypothetical protein